MKPHRTVIAVVSPFLDKHHGTERCVAEQVERLARDYEVHIYSNRVEEMDLSSVVWRRVPALPSPHLFAYGWWFLANQLWRWWDRQFRGFNPALVYSPGVNCFDADVISVHAVFAEVESQVGKNSSLRAAPLRAWPRLVHRNVYYRLIRLLERIVYSKPGLTMACVSQKTANEIARRHQREQGVHVVRNAVDGHAFNPQLRLSRREAARRELGLPEHHLVLLLVGNDWNSKGLPCLLEAIKRLPHLAMTLLVLGDDDRVPYAAFIRESELEQRVRFLAPSPDVMRFYAASDVYVGPSLHDSYGLPVLEAMASGLPVIASSRSGVAEIISAGTDGFILGDPADAGELAELLERLYHNRDLRLRIGESAAKTAQRWTWDRNTAELAGLMDKVLAAKESNRLLEKQAV